MTHLYNPSKHSPKILRSGDPKTRFHQSSAKQILEDVAPARQLLSTSSKIEKCKSVGVLAKVLYLTPGTLCPGATPGCLESCLGHTSGRMGFSTHTEARDYRTALYLERPIVFVKRLRAELTLLVAEALQFGLRPAVRLNGTSDLLWERFDPDLFSDFPEIQFFDYTKLSYRMVKFLNGEFPANYHLTYSVDACSPNESKYMLNQGANVAVVFWPFRPRTWWGYEVIDGDRHDARFLDPRGVIVGLLAKGLARVDTQGFTARPCATCGPSVDSMELVGIDEDTHRTTTHQCRKCQSMFKARWILPGKNAAGRKAA